MSTKFGPPSAKLGPTSSKCGPGPNSDRFLPNFQMRVPLDAAEPDVEVRGRARPSPLRPWLGLDDVEADQIRGPFGPRSPLGHPRGSAHASCASAARACVLRERGSGAGGAGGRRMHGCCMDACAAHAARVGTCAYPGEWCRWRAAQGKALAARGHVSAVGVRASARAQARARAHGRLESRRRMSVWVRSGGAQARAGGAWPACERLAGEWS